MFESPLFYLLLALGVLFLSLLLRDRGNEREYKPPESPPPNTKERSE